MPRERFCVFSILLPLFLDASIILCILKKIKEFLYSHGVPEKVELLPYHAMGENKYASIGKETQHFAPPDENKLNRLKAIF